MFVKRTTLSLAILLRVVVSTLTACYAAHAWANGNFHVVEPGVFYRSGRLGLELLEDVVTREGIRTVVNLESDEPSPAEMNRSGFAGGCFV